MFLRAAVCLWRRRHACPAADNADTTTLEAHCAWRSARSVVRAATPACRVQLESTTSYSRRLQRWCAALCAAETPVPSSARHRDLSATLGRRTKGLDESRCRKTQQIVPPGARTFQLLKEVQSRGRLKQNEKFQCFVDRVTTLLRVLKVQGLLVFKLW